MAWQGRSSHRSLQFNPFFAGADDYAEVLRRGLEQSRREKGDAPSVVLSISCAQLALVSDQRFASRVGLLNKVREERGVCATACQFVQIAHLGWILSKSRFGTVTLPFSNRGWVSKLIPIRPCSLSSVS